MASLVCGYVTNTTHPAKLQFFKNGVLIYQLYTNSSGQYSLMMSVGTYTVKVNDKDAAPKTLSVTLPVHQVNFQCCPSLWMASTAAPDADAAASHGIGTGAAAGGPPAHAEAGKCRMWVSIACKGAVEKIHIWGPEEKGEEGEQCCCCQSEE